MLLSTSMHLCTHKHAFCLSASNLGTHTHTVWVTHRHKLDAGQGKRHAQGQGTGEAFSILLHTPLWPPPLDPTMLCGNEEEKRGGEAETRSRRAQHAHKWLTGRGYCQDG